MYFTDQNIKQQLDPMEWNFEVCEMRKWNIQRDRVKRINEKNGVICLFIMFTPRVMVIKILKMAHYLHFLLMTAKSQSQFWQNIWVLPKGLIEFFHKIVWLIGFGVTVRKILRIEISKKLLRHQKSPKSCIFKGWHLANGSSEPNNP